MNAASSPATARPSIPFGKYWPISRGIALLYCRSGLLPPRPLTEATAIMPGMIVMAGASSFGNAPMSGVRRAADRLDALRAGCPSAKFAVQQPDDCTKPRPKTIAIQFAPIGFVVSLIDSPCQECVAPEPSLPFEIVSDRPSQPPSAFRPMIVTGTTATTITKNCSTSL